jgi:type I restriction enzyme S subunit
LERAKGIAYTGINIETLKQLPIPIAPFAEQQRMVAEVDRRMSVVDALEAVVNGNRKRVLACASRFAASISR